MRQTLCDTCGEDVDRVSLRYVRVSVRGALRVKDTPEYELCESCWEHALESATTRVRQRTEATADFIAQRQQQLPVDQPPPPPPPPPHLDTLCWCLEVNCQVHPQPGDTAADEEAS